MNIRQKIYALLLIVSLIATGVLIYGRVQTERAAKTVEILLDYEEFALMADQMDMPVSALFETLKSYGYTSVAVKEETLYNMVLEGQPLSYDLLKVIQRDLDWREKYGDAARRYLESDQASRYDVVVRTFDEQLFDTLVENISARYEDAFYLFFDDPEIKTIVLKGSIEDIYYAEYMRYQSTRGKGIKLPREIVSSRIEDAGMGFDAKKIEAVQSAGLNLNLRPSNYYKYNSGIVAAYFNDLKKFDALPSAIIFSGNEVLGYNPAVAGSTDQMYEAVLAHEVPVALIEAAVQRGFTEQSGIEDLAEDLNFEIVRVFSVIEYIQERYNYLGFYEGPKEIENVIYRAITERNIRSIYFRPYKNSKFTYFENLESYETMLASLENRLASHQITIGEPSVMPYHYASPYLMLLSALGLVVVGVVTLKGIVSIPIKLEILLASMGIIGVVAIAIIAPNLSIILFSLGAANIFAFTAILFIVAYSKSALVSNTVYTFKEVVVKSTIGLVITIAISMLGGLYVGAFLSRSDYLIEMNFFRGVKLSLILPMVVFVGIYLIQLGYKRRTEELITNMVWADDIHRFLNENIKMYYGFIFAVLGGIVFIYLARSGHESNVEVLSIEQIFRNFLEDLVIARPRTKEILFAFPALTAMFYFAYRGFNRLLFPFALAAVTGITSIINTFCHSRAPIYLSTARSLIALAFAIVIGVVVMAILEIGYKIYVNYIGSKSYE